jgi:hypothetical protein
MEENKVSVFKDQKTWCKKIKSVVSVFAQLQTTRERKKLK